MAPPFFADNYLGNGLTGLAAQLGVWPVPMGEGRNAPPSNEDIARVAVGALFDPCRHAGRVYRPTGPELLSSEEMSDAIGEAVGRRVRHIDVSLQTFLKALRVMGPRAGIDEALMAEVRWYYEEGRLGTWELGVPTTHVRDVAGVEPEDFATIARRYASRPDAERTAGNLARALWDFARIGATPAPRLDRFVQDKRQPVPTEPELSVLSDVWAREHRVEKPRPVPSS